MAAQFKTSFIPKKTLSKVKSKASSVTGGSGHGYSGGGGSTNLFMVGGVIIFLGAGLVAGGLFAYKYKIQGDIRAKSEQLELAEKEIDPNLVTELKELDAQFVKAEEILAEHEALTPFFDFLEQNTIRSVSFDAFQYTRDQDAHSVVMEGEARDYMSLALQSDVLNEGGAIESAAFSDFRLNEAGNVSFQITAQVNPSIFDYRATLAGSEVNETQ